MAAVYQRENVGLRRTPGFVTVIPKDPRARLMFYFDCICTVIPGDAENEDVARLRDYLHYYLLTDDETDALIEMCLKYSPDVFDGVCIFHKPEMCGNLPNKFYELESVRDQFVLTEDVVIGGRQRRVHKIMVYTNVWTFDFYKIPMAFLSKIYLRRLQLIKWALEQAAQGIRVRNLSLPSYSNAMIQGNGQRNTTVIQTSECCVIL